MSLEQMLAGLTSADEKALAGARAEGKTPEEALRSLKRQISDTMFTRLRADARRAAAPPR